MQLQMAQRFLSMGRLDEAEDNYRQILEKDPNDIQANYGVALVYQRKNNQELVVEHLELVLAKNPDHQFAPFLLGKAQQELGRLEQASANFEKALLIDPANAQVSFHLGRVLIELGDVDRAISCLNKGVAIQPNSSEAYYCLGVAYLYSGDTDKSIDSYKRALALKSDLAMAHRGLAFVQSHSDISEEVRAMEALYKSPDLTDADRTQLAFGLGKVYDDLEHYAVSFDFIVEGNRLDRKSYDYSLSDEKNTFQRITDMMSADFISSCKDYGDNQASPIFILGMPRSGTTLVEQILSSHAQVYGAGERMFIQQICTAILNQMTAGNGVFDRSSLGEGAANYLEKLAVCAEGQQHITDKMPHNFLHIGLIKIMFPRARIIHCRRDPVDNCLSLFKNQLSGIHRYSSDLGELGEYYTLYRGLMEQWHKLFPEMIYDVDYEILVDKPEQEIRRLLSYCELEFDAACLKFHASKRAVTTTSSQQVRRPMYQSSVGKWKRYGNKIQPLQDALGLI